MIWALLIFLGIPLWLIAIALIRLLRTRSNVRAITGSFDCKVRPIPSVDKPSAFPRYAARAHWIHDVFLLHGGSPFLVSTTAYGISGLLDGPLPADPDHRLSKLDQPVLLHLRSDTGETLEVACSTASAGAALGPFGSGQEDRVPQS